jgi:hypothetical protein
VESVEGIARLVKRAHRPANRLARCSNSSAWPVPAGDPNAKPPPDRHRDGGISAAPAARAGPRLEVGTPRWTGASANGSGQGRPPRNPQVVLAARRVNRPFELEEDIFPPPPERRSRRRNHVDLPAPNPVSPHRLPSSRGMPHADADERQAGAACGWAIADPGSGPVFADVNGPLGPPNCYRLVDLRHGPRTTPTFGPGRRASSEHSSHDGRVPHSGRAGTYEGDGSARSGAACPDDQGDAPGGRGCPCWGPLTAAYTTAAAGGPCRRHHDATEEFLRARLSSRSNPRPSRPRIRASVGSGTIAVVEATDGRGPSRSSGSNVSPGRP